MKGIREKLHSRRGASLIYALMLFLVASMVSITILTSAATTVSRLHDDREREQDYLTLHSAARMARKAMSGVTIRIEHYDYNESHGDYKTEDGVDHIDCTVEAGGDPLLGEVMKQAAAAAYQDATAKASVKIGSNPGVLRDTLLSFTMKKNDAAGSESLGKYPVEGTLTLVDDEEPRIVYLSGWVPNVDTSVPPENLTKVVQRKCLLDDGTWYYYSETVTIGEKHTIRLTWKVTLSTNPDRSKG